MRLKDYKNKSSTRDIVERGIKPRYFLFGLISGVLLSSAVIFTDIGERSASNIRAQFKNVKISDFIARTGIADILGNSSLPQVEFEF